MREDHPINNLTRFIKERSLLLFLTFKRGCLIFRSRLLYSLSILYNKLKIYEIVYFFYFLWHRYDPKQFNLNFVAPNLSLLFRLHPEEGVTSTRAGELITLANPWQKFLFSMKNTLLGGALQKRVEKVVFYTYLTITLELNNPFDKKTLLFFLNKKITLLERLLEYVKRLNGKLWDQSEIQLHMRVFHRNSLLQAEVIRTMQLAVKKEKKTDLILEVKEAMKKGLNPVLATQGLSGAYWMRGLDRRIIGLFKPFDEEIHAPNNPVGPSYRGALGLRKTRRGCRVGESAHHEVGAFVVDEFFGFGIVPRTYYARFSHRIFFSAREDRFSSRLIDKTKIGSFQEFVGGFVSVDKLAREEIALIPLDEFQLLVVLDVIIGNTDRNIGNILFGDEKIAAIDHGLCFPDRIDSFSFWYWSFLEQGKRPFFKPIIELLNHFPYDELEMRLKKKCFLSNKALQSLRERVALFVAAVNLDLVPSQLEGLFTYVYLAPLRERKTTLKAVAAEQAELYKLTLPPLNETTETQT